MQEAMLAIHISQTVGPLLAPPSSYGKSLTSVKDSCLLTVWPAIRKSLPVDVILNPSPLSHCVCTWKVTLAISGCFLIVSTTVPSICALTPLLVLLLDWLISGLW